MGRTKKSCATMQRRTLWSAAKRPTGRKQTIGRNSKSGQLTSPIARGLSEVGRTDEQKTEKRRNGETENRSEGKAYRAAGSEKSEVDTGTGLGVYSEEGALEVVTQMTRGSRLWNVAMSNSWPNCSFLSLAEK